MDTINMIPDKKNKTKKIKNKFDNNFKLLNELEFVQINDLIENDNIFNINNEKKHKIQKKNKDKDKNKNKNKHNKHNKTNTIDACFDANKITKDINVLSNDSDYLEKKFFKNEALINKKNEILIHNFNNNDDDKNFLNINLKKNITEKNITEKNITEKKSLKSTNPMIQNEVIWYSHDLNSDELELKFKNKLNKNYINDHTKLELKKNNNVNEFKIEELIENNINDHTKLELKKNIKNNNVNEFKIE